VTIKLKDPDAVSDFTLDWSAWLESGESISTSGWTVYPAGADLIVDSDTKTSSTATVTVSGGTHGRLYSLVNTITTSVAGRKDERTIYVRAWEPR